MKGILQTTALAILTAVVMSACGSDPVSSAEVPPAPAPAEVISQVETAKPLPFKELHQLAALYERHNYGDSFSRGEAICPTDGIAFGLLYQNDLLSPYWNNDMWSVPKSVLADINSMFFSDLEKEDLGGCNNYSGDGWNNSPYILALRDSKDLGDGKVSVTYKRTLDDHLLVPVTYEFEPYQLADVPEVLYGLYNKGDTVYRIISVANRPDLLPQSEPQTIEIATAEQLIAAAKRINEGKFEQRFDRYILTADIDLAGIEWTPIGLNNRVLEYWNTNDSIDPNLSGFNGIFDGQGYTIKNLTVTEEQGTALLNTPEQNFPDRNLSGVGFFYNIGSKGEVKNLNIVDASITLPVDLPANYGIAAGILAASCGGAVENIYVSGDVQGVVDVGGMVGRLSGYQANGRMTDCVCDVNVRGNYAVGGLVGTTHYGVMNRCKSIGTVTAIPSDSVYKGEPPRNIGGMFGHSVGGEAYNCYCQAYVLTEVPSACVGGFAGLVEGGQINDCSVNSSILGNWEVIDAYYRTEPNVEVK